MTGAGGEGMVVKPAGNLMIAARGLVQPGVKVRGREYLRIIYGPDYTLEENLPPAGPEPRAKAFAGVARVRPRPRSTPSGGERRGALAGARVRVRRAGHGVRARGPTPLTDF